MQANIHMHTPCSTVQLLGNSLTHYCLTHHWANPLGFSQGTHTFSHVHTHKYTHTLAHKDVIPVLHDGPFPTFFPIVGQLVAELAVGGVGGHQAGPRALAGVARRGGHGRQGRARLLIQQQHPAATACVISNLLSSSSLITPPHFPLFFLPPPPPPPPHLFLILCSLFVFVVSWSFHSKPSASPPPITIFIPAENERCHWTLYITLSTATRCS